MVWLNLLVFTIVGRGRGLSLSLSRWGRQGPHLTLKASWLGNQTRWWGMIKNNLKVEHKCARLALFDLLALIHDEEKVYNEGSDIILKKGSL